MSTLNLGMPVDAFLAEYWQQKPLLARQALPGFRSPLEADELAGLSCEESVESRLVLGPDERGNWSLESGPFEPQRYADVGNQDWTLLVQDADKLVADVEALLAHVDFLPDWRIDDVMISFAAPGGSVGPHWDHYDVFLLQAEGSRRWMIDDRPSPDLALKPDNELKLLQQFAPNRDWLLEPGDLLYLPPGVPHHGIAEDACITYSIGMRAPSHEELLIDFCESIAARLPEHQRYADVDARIARHPGEISSGAIDRIRTIIEDGLALNDEAFRDWVGDFVTRYRMAQMPAAPPEDRLRSLSSVIDAGESLYRNPWARFAFTREDDQATLHVCGQHHRCHPELAQRLCQRQPVTGGELTALGQLPGAKRLLSDLLAAGFLVTGDA